MTARSDIDREMRTYFEARTTTHPPVGLLDVSLAAVDRTRQRPGWLIPEWWLLARISGRLTGPAHIAVRVAIVALLVALLLAFGILVGSRHRLPPPIGLAKPGLITFDLGGIFVVMPDGTGPRQLTPGPSDDRATWSPDGTAVAYESIQPDATSNLMVMSADGGRVVRLVDHLTNFGNIVWSADSRRVAVSGRIAGTVDDHLYLAWADGSGTTVLGGPDVTGQDPSFSPDGTEIAFKRVFPCLCRADALWLIGVDGSNLRELWSQQGSGEYVQNALWNTAWSPDGKRLAFLGAGLDGRFDVYVINADGTDARDITNSPEDEFWPAWSPDGTRIAFAWMGLPGNNQGELVVTDPDGSNPVHLPLGSPINSNTPVWSPDGTRILAYSDPGGGSNDAIVMFDATGKAPPYRIPAANFTSATWQRLAP